MVDYNLMKKDIEDLEIQMKNLLLTIKNVSEIQQQSYDSVSRDLDELTSKYEETTSAVNKLRQENHELECDIQVKTCQEKQKRNEVNRLEIKKRKTKECIAEYNKKIQERVVIYIIGSSNLTAFKIVNVLKTLLIAITFI